MKKRILPILLALIMALTLLPTLALADGTVAVKSYQDLVAAQNAEKDSIIEVSGDIAMTAPVTFQNKVTLRLTETANVTYSSDNNTTVNLITVQDGSTVDFAEGASITMTGDTENRTDARDWRVLHSLGTLTFSECAGSVTVTNAKSRAFFGKSGIVFKCDMAADLRIDNTVGANRYVFAVYSGGNVTINGDLSGTIDVDFGGGNTAAGIYADGITVNGDISGDIDVQLGTSHNAFGLYAESNGITVTGDISGSIYARGGSFNGYAIYAYSGDIAINQISGKVSGDVYNRQMENSHYNASALYAPRGSIYGSMGDDGSVEPLLLNGTLSSTVGRSNAFTVRAGDDVNINIGTGEIVAQSSYAAEWTGLSPSAEPISNNWGGAAAGVLANGDISITGNTDAIIVKSESEAGNPIDAGSLVKQYNLDGMTNIASFLISAACDDKTEAEEYNDLLTSEDKALIDGYDDIVKDLLSVTVNTYDELCKALNDGEVYIVLGENIILGTDGLPGTAISGKTLTIDGNGKTISFTKTNNFTNGVFGNDTNPLSANTKLTVRNLTIENTGTQSGYAALIGYNAHNTSVVFDKCTFKNIYAPVYVNPITTDPEDGGVSVSMNECTFDNTPYSYAADRSAGSYVGAVTITIDGKEVERVLSDNTVCAVVGGVEKIFDDIQSAVTDADEGSTIIVAPGTYDGNIQFDDKSLTIKAQYPAYPEDGEIPADELLSVFTGTFNTSEGTNDADFKADQCVTIDGIAFKGDGLKVGNNNYNTVGELIVKNCTMECGKNLEKADVVNYNQYNYFVKVSGNPGAPYAEVTVYNNKVTGTPEKDVYTIQLWDVSVANVSENLIYLTNAPAGHQAINISKMAENATVIVEDNVIVNATGGIYVTTWLLGGTGDCAFTGDIDVVGNVMDVTGTPIYIGWEESAAPYGSLGANCSITDEGNYNGSAPVVAEVVQKPGEAPVTYVVTVKDGQSIVDMRSVVAGAEYKLPAAPSKPGYIFMGWKGSDGHTHQANETVTVEKDMTFTAVWSNLPDIEPGEPDEPDVPDFPFTDVSVNAWYYEAVKYVYENGIMNGMDRYSFQPNGTLTRAMVWTMLARLDGVDTEGGNSWYAKAQEWATANSVSDGENPTGEVTREQLVTMLYRYAQYKGYDVSIGEDTNILSYVDVDQVSDWAMEAFQWACGTGVIEGDENSALTPKASTTRAQAAAMFMRFIEL